MAVSYSYCYSDTVQTGVTNNAVDYGYTWSMPDLFPDAAGVTVNGVIFKYTIDKDPSADATVNIRNEDAEGTGYIYERNDNWDGLPGSSMVGFDPIMGVPLSRFGDGSISVDGEGTLTEANVRYSYVYDICTNPLADASCPGYEDALAKYLNDLGLTGQEPDLNDPFYDEWVQSQLDQEADVPDEEAPSEEPAEEEEEETLEEALGIENNMAELVGAGNQAEVMAALSALPSFDPYYSVTIQGGQYDEVIELQDAEINDNRRALRSLASDKLHQDMVRSQYERNNLLEN